MKESMTHFANTEDRKKQWLSEIKERNRRIVILSDENLELINQINTLQQDMSTFRHSEESQVQLVCGFQLLVDVGS